MIQIGDLQKLEQLLTGHTYGYQAIVLDYFGGSQMEKKPEE